MKYKYWLSGLAVPFCLSQQALAQKQPHIIFIMTDQQRGDAVGCAGNECIITPNLDALAKDGFFFCNAYSATPSSTPARAGLLTGLSPWHHGMLGYGNVAEHYEYEMPQMVRDCGYLTLGIGKMHWRPQNALHGFHATILDESGRVESPYFCSDYRKWFMTVAPGKNPDVTGIGWNDHKAATYKLPEQLHPTAWTGNVAVRTIEHYEGGQPLFLKISFARPHSPYDPPQRILDMYEGIEMPAPAEGEWSSDIGVDVTDPEKFPSAPFARFSTDYVKNTRRHYYAAVTFIDEQIGRIINALKEKGMYENTLICFTSDHGDMMGDHHHWRKTYAYEGSASIPMIIKTPECIKGARKIGETIEQPVELRDILPTFLETAGAKVPEGMDGCSMLKLIKEETPQWRRWIDMEHATCYSEQNYWCAMTDGKLKYIWFLRTGEEQLFDLVKDPHETVNRTGDRRYRKQLDELRRALAEHLSERGDEWVKDGKLQKRERTVLYSPDYPLKAKKKPEYVFEAQPIDLQVARVGDEYEVKGTSALQVPGHFTWGGSVTKAEDGKYYMIYSAPETGVYPFNNAWIFGSKLGLAVSERPDGNFRHLGFFYNKDGFAEDKSSWDSQSASNPHVRKFGDKYYLYYAASVDPGNGNVCSKADTLPRRDRVQQNQKIGVIIFDSFPELLEGKFVRSDKPLLAPRTRVKPDNVVAPSPKGTEPKPDNLIVVNPAVVYRPTDGKYLLYFKGNVYDPHWRGVHGVAIGDSPDGPFTALDETVFHIEDAKVKLSAEDPYVWYHSRDKRFYAVFKDFNGQFTKGEPCLAVMYSDDGIKWHLPKHSLFMKKELLLLNGDTVRVKRLERPQLLLNEEGDPEVLYAACSIDNVNPKVHGGSFNVQVRIKVRTCDE